MFDLSKILDLSKKFTLPGTLLKTKNYCTNNQNLLILIQNSRQAQMKTYDLLKTFKCNFTCVLGLKSRSKVRLLTNEEILVFGTFKSSLVLTFCEINIWFGI